MGTYADFLAATILKEHASEEQLRRALTYAQHKGWLDPGNDDVDEREQALLLRTLAQELGILNSRRWRVI